MQRSCLIILFVLPSLHSGAAFADTATAAWCRPVPLFTPQIPQSAALWQGTGPGIELTAERFDISQRDVSKADGNVRIEQGEQILQADSVRFDHRSEVAQASGSVRYQDAQLLIRSEETLIRLDSRYALLRPVEYQLRELAGSGKATQAEREDDRTTRLSEVSYSTCIGPRLDWMLSAGELTLDHQEGFGDARQVSFHVGGRKVAYLPRVSFPIDDRRRSGFLYPGLGISNRTGLDVTLPYYLNLAPNYDATLLPRLLTRRGLMLGAEFRYLGEQNRGELEASYLPDDRVANRDRGAVHWRHSSVFSPNWRADVNINRVSDRRYFEDLGDSLNSVSTVLLSSRLALRGAGPWWQTTISADSFQIVDPDVGDAAEPYRRLPRVELFAGPQRRSGLDYGLRAEAVNFQRDFGETGQRYDLMPFVALASERAWGFARPELAWRQTGYSLDRSLGDSSPTRGLPIASFDAGLYFDRATARGRQSLEPRLYYLYVPYREQDDLPLFDTNELTFSFGQLFRSNRFTGADRQQNANQLALALSTRLFEDASGRETFSASIGQIRYFDEQRVQLPGRPVEDRSASAWIGEIAWRPDPRWTVISGLQWDPERSRRDLLTTRVQHRFGEQGVVNVSYRYRRDFIEQIDSSLSMPIGERWKLIARWNHSLLDDRTLETLAGFEYDSCCYALRLLGRQYVRSGQGERSNAIYLEMEFKGLGSLGRRTEEFLQRAILGYR